MWGNINVIGRYRYRCFQQPHTLIRPLCLGRVYSLGIATVHIWVTQHSSEIHVAPINSQGGREWKREIDSCGRYDMVRHDTARHDAFGVNRLFICVERTKLPKSKWSLVRKRIILVSYKLYVSISWRRLTLWTTALNPLNPLSTVK